MAKKATSKKSSKNEATNEKQLTPQEESKLIRKSPLMQEGNDFQENTESELVNELSEEESDVIVAQPREGGRTEPTRNHVKPDHFAETEEEAEEREEAEEKADKASEKGRVGKADFGAARKALDLAEELSNRETARGLDNDRAATKRKLAAQPTTKFMIPLGIGERHGAVETVTINGYRLSIKKGVLVEIPVGVAEILMQHLDVRSEAAEKFDLHRDEATEKALS